jgi:2-desacetyl-2-hydroxyethyl bacteriochlorophyllide A dehydrogenase
MKAAIVSAPHVVEIAEVPDPTPGRYDVVIAVAAAGICGTDLHIVEGEYAASFPVIPGHEFAGTIVAVGAGVHELRVGDRVAADPNIPCLRCSYCHDGRVNLCDNYDAIGVTRDGASAEFVVVPEYLCVVLPDEVELDHAALIEPLSCALHAYDLLGSQVGKRVAIYGSGTMGLMMLQLARRTGVGSVDMIDLNPLKLVAAQAVGASRTGESAAELDPGRGWDLVIDATGAAPAIQDGLSHVAKGGTFLQFGVSAPTATVSISPFWIYDQEITIMGSVCPLNSFERSVALLASGAIDASTLISDRFAIDDYSAALTKFGDGESRKIVITP